MHIAPYVCVSMVVRTDEQNEQGQIHAIPLMHNGEETTNKIYWYAVLLRMGHRPLGANIGAFVSTATNTMSWLHMNLNCLVVLSAFLRQPIKGFNLDPVRVTVEPVAFELTDHLL